jgi:hypothetical protein
VRKAETDPIAQFVALSSALTGHTPAELWGTGMVAEYFQVLEATVGEEKVGELLTVWNAAVRKARRSERRLETLIARDILGHDALGDLARNLIMLWYLGQWFQLPLAWRDRYGASVLDQTRIVSAEAYKQGLVWEFSHPQGAKAPGYGSWALKPRRSAR